MKLNFKNIVTIIAGLIAIAALYVFNYGLYPRFFDIEWDEEVKLHDGRVIVVHVKNTYERQKKNSGRYDENSIQFRHKELTFERNPGEKYTLKTRMPLAYLGRFDEKWYIVISGQGPYGNFPDELPTRWGDDFSTRIQRVAILEKETFQPIRWEDAPSALISMNLTDSIFWKDFVAWDGLMLSLNQKLLFQKTHPAPEQGVITRPIRMNSLQKEIK